VESAAETVSSPLRILPWVVWHGYEVRRAGGGDAYVMASPVPRRQRRESRRLAAPLRDTPDLFLEFAELADHEIDEEVWRDWFTRYGVLGLKPALPYMASVEGGPEETFSRFVDEARIANGVLRLWEAATMGMGDEELVDRYLPQITLLQDRAKGLLGVWYADVPRSTTAPWLSLVGTIVQSKLTTECYPQLLGTSGPTFGDGYGFRSLLGAMYLQMFWLMTAKGGVRRCKEPECPRVITFDQPEQKGDPSKHNDRSMGYRTRVDKVFCSAACKQRDYDRRKRTSRD
jgi:hypothetical protein